MLPKYLIGLKTKPSALTTDDEAKVVPGKSHIRSKTSVHESVKNANEYVSLTMKR